MVTKNSICVIKNVGCTACLFPFIEWLLSLIFIFENVLFQTDA